MSVHRPNFGRRNEALGGVGSDWFTARKDEASYLQPSDEQRERAATFIAGTVKELVEIPEPERQGRIAELVADEARPSEVSVLKYMKETDWLLLELHLGPEARPDDLDHENRIMAMRIARLEQRQGA